MKIITRKDAIAQGLKRYFTGKPCVHGHVAEREVNGYCLTCKKIRYVEWCKKNKERIRKQRAEYRKKNKERIKENSAEYRKKNKARIDEQQAEYKKKNKERIKEKRVEWCKKNKERIKEKTAEYRKNKNDIETLHDNYIKMRLHQQFGIPAAQATPELIEAKRQDLLTKRLMKQIRKGARK